MMIIIIQIPRTPSFDSQEYKHILLRNHCIISSQNILISPCNLLTMSYMPMYVTIHWCLTFPIYVSSQRCPERPIYVTSQRCLTCSFMSPPNDVPTRPFMSPPNDVWHAHLCHLPKMPDMPIYVTSERRITCPFLSPPNGVRHAHLCHLPRMSDTPIYGLPLTTIFCIDFDLDVKYQIGRDTTTFVQMMVLG